MKPVDDGFHAPAVDRRKVLLGLLFGSAAAIAAWRQPRRRLDYLGREKLEDLIPKTIGQWKFVAASGLVIPPEDQLSRTLYSQLLTRVYSDGQNTPVMLLIAQSAGQTGILQVHRPETCYPASGFAITPVEQHDIPLGPATLRTNMLSATSEDATEHIVYWTRVGDRVPTTWKQQKLDVAEDNLRGVIPDAVLVRISTVNSDPAAAEAILDAFARSLIGSVPPLRRPVLIA
jgi:EpsI family protein